MAKKPEKVDVQGLLKLKVDLGDITITPVHASLYAVGVGFNQDPLRKEDFKYTNEISPSFVILPTISTTIGLKQMLGALYKSPYLPEFGAHQLLHAEERLHMIHSSIKPNIAYKQVVEVIDVIQKGKNAFFYLRQNSYAKNSKGEQELAFYTDRTIFIRDLGGFGSKGSAKIANIPQIPKRKPDIVLKDKTYPSQAFVFRLCNDDNVLHIDPDVAALGGFQRPIIHGMASYGVVARSIVQNLLGNNPELIKSFESRLVGHVYPGENFNINIWKEGSKLLFEVEVVERKKKALVGALTIREGAKL